jgi:hypothetical protein
MTPQQGRFYAELHEHVAACRRAADRNDAELTSNLRVVAFEAALRGIARGRKDARTIAKIVIDLASIATPGWP